MTGTGKAMAKTVPLKTAYPDIVHPNASPALQVRLMTFNIRYANPSPVSGEDLWQDRCPRLCAQIRFATSGLAAVFVCLQEVLHEQLVDILNELTSYGEGEHWSYLGHGREDGKEAGEYAPILYRTNTWVCERDAMYWLSDKPDRPSVGWDAALERVVTLGQFKHRITGIRVIMMNTHFDHRGEKARLNSVRLILDLAKRWRESLPDSDTADDRLHEPGTLDDPYVPTFLAGDFNSEPTDGAYKAITSADSMVDLSTLLEPRKHYGHSKYTYTSFGEPGEVPKIIDFLFVDDFSLRLHRRYATPDATKGKVEVRTFGVLSNRFDDNVYLSDHRPVVSDVIITVQRRILKGRTGEGLDAWQF
ncbi:hypothetical protein SEUCBS139899_007830 [Sporothrix eucalyptigena]|uniref:Endonuclease/exonuclease/phosphatase domain-containing protein n=1 Tax=Sporothrix eucalyptigena TaxID=1812306 RepID=A0ABP0AS26_9PEZI